MSALDDLRELMPDAARDLKLNLQAVLGPDGPLSPAQRWGVAVAAAVASRNPRLRAAILAEARAQVEPGVVEDGIAAAALMGMNNVYYRFRHLIGHSPSEYQRSVGRIFPVPALAVYQFVPACFLQNWGARPF